MKELKGAFVLIAAMLFSYFNKMLIPVLILMLCMILDYFSGMTAAWIFGELNSGIGKRGAIKKVCYMLLVVVAGVVDWLLQNGLQAAGITYNQSYLFGMMVAIWLTLNELISILENCARIGVPIPKFLKPVVEKLKIVVEQKGNQDDDSYKSSLSV